MNRTPNFQPEQTGDKNKLQIERHNTANQQVRERKRANTMAKPQTNIVLSFEL